jgi:hypothetical protein
MIANRYVIHPRLFTIKTHLEHQNKSYLLPYVYLQYAKLCFLLRLFLCSYVDKTIALHHILTNKTKNTHTLSPESATELYRPIPTLTLQLMLQGCQKRRVSFFQFRYIRIIIRNCNNLCTSPSSSLYCLHVYRLLSVAYIQHTNLRLNVHHYLDLHVKIPVINIIYNIDCQKIGF